MDILIASLLQRRHLGICPRLIQLPDGWRSNSYLILSPWRLRHPRNGDISSNLLSEIIFPIQIYCISLYPDFQVSWLLAAILFSRLSASCRLRLSTRDLRVKI